MEKVWKMSPKRYNDVPQLVEKTKAKYPEVDRDLLRKLIRLENPNLFHKQKNQSYRSNLKKLDRHLKKAFSASNQSQDNTATLNYEPNSIYEKRLETIRQENLSIPIIAYADLCLFIDTLPSHIKDKLVSELQTLTSAITKANQWRPFEEQTQKQERVKTVISIAVLYFINKIPMLLNEEFGSMKEKRK